MNATALPFTPPSSTSSPVLADVPAQVEAAVDLSHVHAYVKRARLMLVDDDPVNFIDLEMHLRGFGHNNFVKATNPTDALSMISRERPELVLMDINLAQGNGLELLEKIRSEDRWRCMPIIVLTANCDPATRRKALGVGCNDFLSKPVDFHELALRIRNMLVANALYDLLATHTCQLEAEASRQAATLRTAQQGCELRYHAGKAEVATEVLHNVGNALNSVNIGVNIVAQTVQNSKVLSLQRAVGLLSKYEGNLPHFLTNDERGKVLPSYLCDVADSLLQERDKMASELELLTKHLRHINAVVTAQQKYATQCDAAEEVQLADVLAHVDELLAGSVAKYGIEVTREYEKIPAVWTDRQKLLQVLLNVVKNAIESATQANKPGLGRLEIRLGRQSEASGYIEIKDNGVGISPANLSKLFSHGFTTKPEGHGFGLHSSANIIKELGGSIQVFSDGVGRGATFHLELPFKHQEN